ncbi:transcription factor MYB16-like [Hibiscus syriacus]|uniref:transcription factor MYB16-like n=1 Tax=Hibiscus syriacus TaxID=106335 RepID=UPI00192195A7|nr:transcription factor MYB16-like [Hibiscus syriacus]
MGRSRSRIDANGLKRGPWTPEEDEKLMAYIKKHGHGSWSSKIREKLQTGMIKYLRPGIKRGRFSLQGQKTIIQLMLSWAIDGLQLLLIYGEEQITKSRRKKLAMQGIDPSTHRPVAAPSGSVNNDSKKV